MRRMCAAIALIAALALPVVAGSTDAGGEHIIELGRKLFHGAQPLSVPARLEGIEVGSGCSQCHGRNGRGLREAGVRVPSIRWNELRLPLRGLSGYADEGAVATAIAQGIGRQGGALRAPMPYYRLTATEQQALLAYLHVVGTDIDATPGIDPQRIRVGSVLPLSGSLAATGAGIRDVLAKRFDRINRQGGVYGRRIEFEAIDGGSDVAGLVDVLQSKAQDEHLFAIVGSYLPQAEFVPLPASRARVPVLYSLGVPLRASDDPWSTYVLASVSEQVAALGLRMEQQCALGGTETQVFYPAGESMRAALVAAGVSVTALRPVGDGDDVIGPLRSAGSHRAITLLDRGRSAHLRQRLGSGKGNCLGSLAALSGVPPADGGAGPLREIVAMPLQLPSISAPQGTLWQSLADVAAQGFIETLSRSGRQLDREALVEVNASLHGFPLDSGLLLNFDDRRHYGLDVAFLTMGGSDVPLP